jgi:hypothetical protein
LCRSHAYHLLDLLGLALSELELIFLLVLFLVQHSLVNDLVYLQLLALVLLAFTFQLETCQLSSQILLVGSFKSQRFLLRINRSQLDTFFDFFLAEHDSVP